MNTTISKGMRGTWQAETFLPFDGKKQLQVSTFKNHRGNLVTIVKVVEVDRGMVTYTPFSDYNTQADGAQQKCTKANVESQHSGVLVEIERYREEAHKFYKEQAK